MPVALIHQSTHNEKKKQILMSHTVLLHAIKNVLQQSKTPLTSIEIADQLNVSKSNVNACLYHNPSTFAKVSEMDKPPRWVMHAMPSLTPTVITAFINEVESDGRIVSDYYFDVEKASIHFRYK